MTPPAYASLATSSAIAGATSWEICSPSPLLMDGDNSVIAVFNPTVKVTKLTSNTGTVTPAPSQPVHGYNVGTAATIPATPSKGYKFGPWSGDLSSSESPHTIAIDSPKVINANCVKPDPFQSCCIGIGGAVLLPPLMLASLSYMQFAGRFSHGDRRPLISLSARKTESSNPLIQAIPQGAAPQ